MTTAADKLRWFNAQSFPKQKPRDTYRIFSLGGSTTYGRPYTDPVSFSGWLRELLPVADPTRKWEVINAGGISYASYRLSILMDELAHYEPDLFLIYTGHNEFLEKRTYGNLTEAPRLVTALGGWASRTRTFAAGQRLLAPLMETPAEERTVLSGEVNAILDNSRGPDDYHRDDVQRDRAFEHFRFNLNRMVDVARSAGAEIVFISPASNFKDCSPFKSEPREGLDAGTSARFQALMEEAAQASAQQQWEQAVRLLTQAREIDSRHAELHYRLGQALYQLERYAEAESEFARAVDEDVCPLRAPAAISRIMAETAESRSVSLVDFAKTIRERSPHGIADSSHFLDHVHLDAQGYGLLAIDIVNTLARMGVVRLSDSWDEENRAAAARRVSGRIDQRAHGESLRNLAKVFAWAGKHEEAARLAAQAAEILGDDAEAEAVLGHAAARRGDRQAALHSFQEAVRIRPDSADAHFDLGAALQTGGQYEEAARHFRKALELAPDSDGAVHYNLGLALQGLGNLRAAEVEFRGALAIDPDRLDALRSLGSILLLGGRAGDAVDHFREALARHPTAESHFNLGIALAMNGTLEEAISEYKEAISLNPSDADAHNNLGIALAFLGRTEEAITSFQEAIRIRPAYPEAHENLGRAYTALGQGDAARRHFEEAKRLKSNAP